MLYLVKRFTLAAGVAVVPTSFALTPDGTTFFYRDTVNTVRKVVFPASDVAFANLAFAAGAMSGNNMGNAKLLNGCYCCTAEVAPGVAPQIKQLRLSDGTIFTSTSGTVFQGHSPIVTLRPATGIFTPRVTTFGGTATPNGRTRSAAINKPALNVVPTNVAPEIVDDITGNIINQIQFFNGTDDGLVWTNGWSVIFIHLGDATVSNVGGIGCLPFARIASQAADGAWRVENVLQGMLSDRGGAVVGNLRYTKGNNHPCMIKQGPDSHLYGFTRDTVDGKIYYYRLLRNLATPYTDQTFVDTGFTFGGALAATFYDHAYAMHVGSNNIYFTAGQNVHTLRKAAAWPYAVKQSIDLRPAGGAHDQISYILISEPFVYCVLTSDGVATPNEIVQLYDTDLAKGGRGRRGGELFSIIPEVGRYLP